MTVHEYILFGDAEAAVVDILSHAPEIVALNPEGVSTSLIGYQRGDLWIEVTRQGGSYSFPLPESARIDIHAYGRLRSDALDLISICQAVMFREAGTYTGHGCSLVACQVETGIFESSDKDTDQINYALSLRLTVKPA